MDRGALKIVAAFAIAFTGLGAFATAASAAGEARIIKEERIKPRVVELTITTPAFSEPTHVHVDLPVGYDDAPDRRWPVTYVLAGTMNTYKTFNNFVDGVGLTKDYPSIVVSPNGDSGYWSDWYNDGAGGPPMYETYVIEQLIDLIDAHFRTIADRSERAVMGISMGGYGAMMVAARHPDLFAAAASLSGAVDSNLTPQGAVLSLSPTFQGGRPDAIYGPRATQEVRWRGHNPTDLADNLRDLDLQVLSSTGVPNPGIGEDLLSADSVSCVVEGGVYMSSQSFRRALTALGIPHLWKDYGPGCHTVPNFNREITDALIGFKAYFAKPRQAPKTFTYTSIEPAFDVYGWSVRADPKRPLEFMEIRGAGARGATFVGSGRTTVTTPPFFAGGVRKVDVVRGGAVSTVAPTRDGRVAFTVDLGAPSSVQQYTPGATTNRVRSKVALEPHALARVTAPKVSRRGVRVCAEAVGGDVIARLRVQRGRSPLVRSVVVTVPSGKTLCRSLPWARRVAARTKVSVQLRGHDRFGHLVSGRRALRLRAAAGG